MGRGKISLVGGGERLMGEGCVERGTGNILWRWVAPCCPAAAASCPPKEGHVSEQETDQVPELRPAEEW